MEFGVPMKLVRLIKMCLNVTYSKVPSSSKWSKPRRCSITTAFQLALEYAIKESPGKQGRTEINLDTSAAALC
jgi:hypothetical protein